MKSAAKKELQDLRGLRFCLLFVDCDFVIVLLSEHHLWLFFLSSRGVVFGDSVFCS